MKNRIVYGINPVREAIRAGGGNIERIIASGHRRDRTLDAVLREALSMNLRVERVAPDELVRLCGGAQRHQGVAALMKGGYGYRSLEDLIASWKGGGEKALFLMLDSIQDPQNMGALIRSAHSAGASGVIVPKDRSSEITPVVAKASAGATEHTAVARVTNLRNAIKLLKERGVWVIGVEADSGRSIYEADLTTDVAMVIGSEGSGIRRLVREECDYCVSIPMKGRVGSLNAAQAGTVALFEAMRQRGFSALKDA